MLAFLLASCINLPAQSTYGSIIGTVKDASGAAIPNAMVKLDDLDENNSRQMRSDANGSYQFLNVLPAHYNVVISQEGFDTFNANNVRLIARQTLRIDATLQVGQTTQSVTVEGSSVGVITTDTPAISDSLNPTNFPVNVRANGNTSPYLFIQAMPGVQPDEGGNYSIQGGLPSQTQYSVDGISVTNVGGNSPLTNAFPSTESIAEIKVQGVGNNAEYGQVGDVTTISKSGTNVFHGDTFWYTQNAALNAVHFGDISKPKLIANDYGASAGGPVIIPKLYNGKDRTFFYGTYEGFRYPKETPIQNTVPTEAMRNGNFGPELAGTGESIHDLNGNPYPNNVIPQSQLSPLSQKFLSLYPLPNFGDTSTVSVNNYRANRDSSYHNEQYDTRIDQYITSKQSAFARWTWKNIDYQSPNNLAVPSSSSIDQYRMLAAAHTYAITPTLLNEARFGFTLNNNGSTNSFDGKAFLNSLGFDGLLGGTPFFNGLSYLSITNFQDLDAGRLEAIGKSQTFQWADNLTWTKGRHTIKTGMDIRRIRATSPLGFISGDNYGGFSFNGIATGQPFGDFLLGIPYYTELDDVQQDNDGRSIHYNAYAQDSYRVNENLTLEFGLRFEFHPGYTDASGNIGNFDPSVPGSGAVIYPDGKASLLAPGYLQSFNACPVLGSREGPVVNGVPCTPVLSASQAGLPNSLRTAPYRFMPRFGFAYRPFGNNKTVIRGGFSVYNTEVLGSIYYSLTGTLQSSTFNYSNSVKDGVPDFRWPQVKTGGSGIDVSPYGTAYFGTANQIDFKDPYSEQWNLSIDRDLGHNTGVRVSYIGMVTRDLVHAPDYNQPYYSTTFFDNRPLTDRPFPNWGEVNSRNNGANANYHSAQIEFNHRYKDGLTFNSAYTLAKNLSDSQGYATTNFGGETSGSRSLDIYNLKSQYGDVGSTRRHRWLSSVVYELPFGRGKAYGGSMNRALNAVVGGWQVSSIFLWQSGPFLTPYFSDGDPSGTGSGNYEGRAQAPDLLGGGNLAHPTAEQWFNVGSFTCPGVPNWTPGHQCLIGTVADTPDPVTGAGFAPLGRFGNAGKSKVIGPGTVNLNAGVAKYFNVTERVRIKVEASFTNAFNHLNLNTPNLAIDSTNPGLITSATGANFGGSRTGQVGAKIEF
jgi:hypothetical protein